MGKKSRRNKPNRGAAPAAAAPRQQGGGQPSRGRGHPFTPTTQAELDAITTPPVVSSDENDPVKAPKGANCWICLEGPDDDDGNDEPLRRNCACRGTGGFAHITCLAAMATSDSEEIWAHKKKAAPNANQMAFGWPWHACHNCKQFYVGQVREDIAQEFARSTEGMVGGQRVFRHVTAKSWLAKSMIDNRGLRTSAADVEEITSEFDELLDLIKSSYPMYDDSSSHPMLAPLIEIMSAHLLQAEAEANYNYACWLGERLRFVRREESAATNEEEQKALYNKWDKLINTALQKYNELKGTSQWTNPHSRRELESAMMQLTSHRSLVERDYSHLAQDGKAAASSTKTNVLDLSKKLMDTNIAIKGEASTDGIKAALQYVQEMMRGGEEYRPYEVISLLLKTSKTATRTLGPSHPMTCCARDNLEKSLTYNQKVAYHLDPRRNYHQVERYEDDVDVYILHIENWEDDTEHFHGPTIAWAPGDLILKRGALVTCVGLKKAEHLNGKRGHVEEYDDTSGRHLVKFEDGTKPCLVKGANLRLLFRKELEEGCAP